MTALRKFAMVSNELTSDAAALFCGEGTDLFSSGSIAEMHSDALTGAVTGMFSSGSAPTSASDGLTGDGTQLFSSGS